MVYRQTRGKRQTTTLDACASWDTWRLAVATTPAPATLTAYNPIKHTTYRDEYKERLRLAVCVQKSKTPQHRADEPLCVARNLCGGALAALFWWDG